MRAVFPIIALLCGAIAANAQPTDGIDWSLKVEQSVARAQQTGHPLMFWVLGRSSSRDNDIENAQRRAFRDPHVVLLSRYFVAARMSRSRYRDYLVGWDLHPRTNLQVIFVTPKGELIDTLGAGGVAQPESLARKMHLVIQAFRQQVYDAQVRPILEPDASAEKAEKKPTDEELLRALRTVRDHGILTADVPIAKLLKQTDLSQAVRAAGYDALATLSTPASAEALYEWALDDARAAAALAECTPEVAERLLSKLDASDPDAEHRMVYNAVTRICRVSNVKPDRFWEGTYKPILEKEVERVGQIVERTAARWKEVYGEYR